MASTSFVWLFQISGAVPASHLVGGYRGAVSKRQPPMYFRLGGGTLTGVCKPGEVVWSRVFVENGRLKVDMGRASAIKLPEAETNRRWAESLRMARDARGAAWRRSESVHGTASLQPCQCRLCALSRRGRPRIGGKATMFHAMGLEVHLCGVEL